MHAVDVPAVNSAGDGNVKYKISPVTYLFLVPVELSCASNVSVAPSELIMVGEGVPDTELKVSVVQVDSQVKFFEQKPVGQIE